MKKFISLLAIMALFLSACNLSLHRVRGNGTIKTENRPVSPFTNVDVSGNYQVYLKQDSTSSVSVEADENLMQHIIIGTENGTLFIETEDGVNLDGSRDIKVYVSSPSFRDLRASGACDIIGEDTIRANTVNIKLTGASEVDLYLDAPQIRTEASGASSIRLRGKTKDFSIDGSGAMKVRCEDLLAENVDVDISGAGSAHVFASVRLNAEVSGAGNIKYRGNATVTKDISGAGSVSKDE